MGGDSAEAFSHWHVSVWGKPEATGSRPKQARESRRSTPKLANVELETDMATPQRGSREDPLQEHRHHPGLLRLLPSGDGLGPVRDILQNVRGIMPTTG